MPKIIDGLQTALKKTREKRLILEEREQERAKEETGRRESAQRIQMERSLRKKLIEASDGWRRAKGTRHECADRPLGLIAERNMDDRLLNDGASDQH